MKKIVFILTLLFFQQSLYSQKDIVGKVEFYKSNDTNDKISMSTPDKQIDLLNSRQHEIEISQSGIVSEYDTDEYGFFKFTLKPTDSLILSVNKKSSVLNKTFRLNATDLNDTIRLRISDKKFAIYRDSIASPEFYLKYKEEQAYWDFENGRKRILAGGGFFSEESMKRREIMTDKYGIEYDYLLDCVGFQSELRIMYRYNEVMKKLLGIKNVW